LLKIYGPKKEEAYNKAKELIIVTTPSACCKKLIDLLCNNNLPWSIVVVRAS
jgi:hypothetical protein